MQVAYLDFVQITADDEPAPMPTHAAQAVAAPVPAPVSLPLVVRCNQQRWPAFAQFVPDWVAWRVII